MSLVTKLRLNIDLPLVLIEAPDNAYDLFAEFEIKTSLAGKSIPQVIFFALNKKTLDTFYPKVIAKLADDAIFWIAYPKQSSGISSDLTRMTGNAWDNIIYAEDYTIVSSAAIDDTWTGMRIKKKDPNAKYKREVPIAERKTEGIDYIKRTVNLPKDAVAAMKPFKGLEDFFNTMAFTHKKEYVEAIAEAKKTETRQRRIEKMIEMVQKLKMEKELKKKK
jgi:hypothetical protein